MRVHEFQELFHRCEQLERKAYGAIGKEMEAIALFRNAKSEADLQEHLEQYERSHQACEQAMARYDQLSLLLPVALMRVSWEVYLQSSRSTVGV